jgi:hypothetical protein
MPENPHCRELLQHLNDFQAEYLIVGGYALTKYAEPRYTKDLEIWVHNSVPRIRSRCSRPLKNSGLLSITMESHRKHSHGAT